jgi:hypothetical protein
MAYNKTTWVADDGTGNVGTRFTAARMNNIEQGIADAHAGLTTPENWHNVGAAGEAPFENNWTNLDINRRVRFYKHNGRVFLEGILGPGAGAAINQTMFTLPANYRPTHAGAAGLSFVVWCSGGAGDLAIFNTGAVQLAAGNTAWVDLSSVSFRCV